MTGLKYLKSLFILSVFISTSAFAQQGAPIKDADLLEKEKSVLVEMYPHVFKKEDIKDVRKLDSKHSIVYYTRNNRNFETIVNSSRKDLLIVATCEEISIEELPKLVKDNFVKDNKGSDIKKVFLVTTPYSDGSYRFDIAKGGETESLFYDDMGNKQKAPY